MQSRSARAWDPLMWQVLQNLRSLLAAGAWPDCPFDDACGWLLLARAEDGTGAAAISARAAIGAAKILRVILFRLFRTCRSRIKDARIARYPSACRLQNGFAVL